MGKLQGFIKPIHSTTLRIWRRERDEIELAWDGQDILLYQNGKYLRKITETPTVQIEVWDSTKTYLAGDTFVSYKSPEYQNLAEDDPLSENYIYRCIENANPGESPATHPDKWYRQGKVGQQGVNTIFLSDVSGLEEALAESVRYTDFSDEFSVVDNVVSLDIEYLTLSDFSGKDYVQPDQQPAAEFVLSTKSIELLGDEFTSVSINLIREPISDVTFTITSLDTSVATINGQSHLDPIIETIQPQFWEAGSSFLVYGKLSASDISTQVKVEITDTTDDKYSLLSPQYIDVDVIALEEARFVLSKMTMHILEGTSDSFSIVLTMQPSNNVVMGISSANEVVATVDLSNITFTTSNWNVPQVVSVSAIESGATKDLYTGIIVGVDSSLDPEYSALQNKRVGIRSINVTEADPSEVKIGNTIWKTSNETWDDGGDNIWKWEPTEEYGLYYEWEGVQRLLANNPGYRLPTEQDYEELKSVYPYPVGSRPYIYADGTKLFSNADLYDPSFPWQAIDDVSGLHLQPSGYLKGPSSPPPSLEHRGFIPYIWSSKGRIVNPYLSGSYEFFLLGTEYFTDGDHFKFKEVEMYIEDIKTAFPVRLVKDI